MDDEKRAFAERLKALVAQRRFDDAKVARRVHVQPNSFSNYTRGKGVPNLTTLRNLCTVLETTPNRLFSYNDDPSDSTGATSPHRGAVLAALAPLNADHQADLAALAWALVRRRKGGA